MEERKSTTFVAKYGHVARTSGALIDGWGAGLKVVSGLLV